MKFDINFWEMNELYFVIQLKFDILSDLITMKYESNSSWPIYGLYQTLNVLCFWFFFSIEFRFHRFLLVLVSYPQQIEAPWWHVLWYFMYVWVHQLDTFLQEFIRALVVKNGSQTCFWLLCFVQGKSKGYSWNIYHFSFMK